MWQAVQSTELWSRLSRVEASHWKKVAIGVGCLHLGWSLYWAWACYRVRCKISAKQQELRQSLDQMRDKLLAEGETLEKGSAITSLTFSQLVEKLQKGQLKAVDVLHAYQAKALAATEKCNCVVEFIKEAETYAAECDAMTAEERNLRPLHGVPISLKENYALEGYDTTAGLACFIHKPSAETCVIVTALKKLGAVPFVRTNIPQTMISFECSNPIYGVTTNPYDSKRGPGGSSGGEGALIALGGSILGFGSDIGGSIRIPSHMNGVCGLKPCVQRLSKKGTSLLAAGQTVVESARGPLAQNVDTLIAAMMSLMTSAQFDLDPSTPPVPFRRQLFEDTRPLRIGYFTHNGVVQPAPACARAVLEIKASLEDQGHMLMEFKPPKGVEVMTKIMCAFFGDDAEEYRELMKYDRIDPSCSMFYYLSPWTKTRWLISKILKYVFRDPGSAAIAAGNQCKTISDWWHFEEAVEAYKSEFLELWQTQGLDVLICPGFGCCAVPLGKCGMVNVAASYTSLFNLLDFPAGSLPVTKVTPQDEADLQDPAKYPAPSLGEKYIRSFGKGSAGLPVNIQCVGLPFQEERVLRLMKEVENIVQGKRVF